MAGFLILAGLAAVSTVVFFLDTIRRALVEGPEIVVLAAEARGLTPGSDVWVAGSPAGRVTRVRFADPEGPAERRVVIHATLHWAALPFLRSEAEVTIGSSSLLAPVVLKLDPGAPGSGPFDSADTLTGPPVRSTDQVLSLARAARAALDTLALLSHELGVRLAEGPGTAARLRRDTVLVDRMVSISAKGTALASALRADDAFPNRFSADSLGAAVSAMAGAFRGLRGEERAADAADAIVGLAERLERISVNLDRMDRELRAGKGTAGRALYDDEIARQQAAFNARLDSLRSELRRTPRRWLRFKLF